MSSPLLASILQSQAALSKAETEIGSGAPADLGLTLGATTGQLLSMQSNIDELNNFAQTNAVATTRLSATSSALTSMLSTAQSIASSLATASTAGGTTSGLAASATNALQSLMAGLNTSAGGQSVFAGINTGTTPIADYFATSSSAKSAVDGAFQRAFGTSQTSAGAASISGTAMQSFLDNQFANFFTGSGWQANWSSASSQTIQSTVAPSQTMATSVSANQGAFQQIAEAYTMLNEFTGDSMSTDAKAAVVSTASQLMSAGIVGLTDIAANVGSTQSSITAANTQNTAQATVLQTSAGTLDSVDPAALSNQVATLQTQLEASYELTSQLHSLSLVNYLTTVG